MYILFSQSQRVRDRTDLRERYLHVHDSAEMLLVGRLQVRVLHACMRYACNKCLRSLHALLLLYLAGCTVSGLTTVMVRGGISLGVCLPAVMGTRHGLPLALTIPRGGITMANLAYTLSGLLDAPSVSHPGDHA